MRRCAYNTVTSSSRIVLLELLSASLHLVCDSRMTNTLAYEIKRWLLVYWLPSQAIAEAFPLILGTYISTLALLRNLAASDSQNQLSNETLFEQAEYVDEYYNYSLTELEDNYTVSVSSAVLWVCREGSPDGEFYRTLYGMAIGCLIAFHVITSASQFFTAQFWFTYEVSKSDDKTTTITRYKKQDGIIFITIVGAIFLNLSFLLLLLSYDIIPWSCMSKPSKVDIEYISSSNRLDIQIEHTHSAIRFQRWASIISLVLALSWLVARIAFFCRDVINEKVDHRLNNFYDVPDTGPSDQDKELLEVNDHEDNNVTE